MLCTHALDLHHHDHQTARATHPTTTDQSTVHDGHALPDDPCEVADGDGGGMIAEVDNLVDAALVTEGTLTNNYVSASSTIHSNHDIPERSGTRQGNTGLKTRGLGGDRVRAHGRRRSEPTQFLSAVVDPREAEKAYDVEALAGEVPLPEVKGMVIGGAITNDELVSPPIVVDTLKPIAT